MGFSDYQDFVIRNGQTLDCFDLLDKGYNDKRDFLEDNEFESDTAGYKEAILVFIPTTKNREEIFQIPLTELRDYKHVTTEYNWDTLSFKGFSGYLEEISSQKSENENLIWTSPDKAGYYILNFVPEIYKIFVTQEISYKRLPMWMYYQILSNRGIDISISFPSLNKSNMFNMIVFDPFPCKKDTTFHVFDFASFPKFSNIKLAETDTISKKLYITPEFKLECQGFASRVQYLLPKFDGKTLVDYENVDFNIDFPVKSGDKFKGGTQVYLKMRVARSVYSHIQRLMSEICIFPKCRKQRVDGNNFCPLHRKQNIPASLSKYEEVQGIGTKKQIRIFLASRKRTIEKKIGKISQIVYDANKDIEELIKTEILKLTLSIDGKKYTITLK